MEPPASLACAIGTMPLATAAADPPLDPPVVRLVSHGLAVGPNSAGSAVGRMPNSQVLVLPRMTRPARRSRTTSSLSTVDTLSRRNRLPSQNRRPAASTARSLSRNGTPANGPSGSPAVTASRACSNAGVMTALSDGLRASRRRIAKSTRSPGATSRSRTSAACVVESSAAMVSTSALS